MIKKRFDYWQEVTETNVACHYRVSPNLLNWARRAGEINVRPILQKYKVHFIVGNNILNFSNKQYMTLNLSYCMIAGATWLFVPRVFPLSHPNPDHNIRKKVIR